jgi:hypothetical protein
LGEFASSAFRGLKLDGGCSKDVLSVWNVAMRVASLATGAVALYWSSRRMLLYFHVGWKDV